MIDTHAHVFHRGLPLAASHRYAPDYDAPLELYLRQLDENGIVNGVLVQPSFLGADNSYLVESLIEARGRLRGIAVVAPDAATDELDRLNDAGVVGLRLNLVGKPLPVLTSHDWSALLERVAKLRWQIEIQRTATDLAALLPTLLSYGIDIVLDHYALPDANKGALDPCLMVLSKWGATRRLWVKISAPYRIGGDHTGIAREVYLFLRQSLGRDRLMWGSDWPHTQFESAQNYPKNLAVFSKIVGDADDIAAILENPRQLFRFG